MCRVQRAPSRGHWSRVPNHKGWVKLTQAARQCPAPNVPAVTSRHKLNKGSCLNHQSWVPLTPTSRLSPSVCLSTPLLFMAPRMFLILEYSLSWHKPCALMWRKPCATNPKPSKKQKWCHTKARYKLPMLLTKNHPAGNQSQFNKHSFLVILFACL